tara:strand:- start:31 stop:720 length:690 start_codon:yes stop_codon:yes gene_type:complete
MKVHTLVVDSGRRDTALYSHPNNFEVELDNPIYDVSEIKLVSSQLWVKNQFYNTSPHMLIRITVGSDELGQSLTTSNVEPHFTGIIFTPSTSGSVFTHNGSDDPVIHRFHTGNIKMINKLKIELLYLRISNGDVNRLRVYSLQPTENNIFKFEIKGSTDKLEGLTKVPLDKFMKKKKEKTKEEKVKNLGTEILYNQEVYIYIGIIAFFGIVLMFLMKGGSNVPPPPPPT